MNREEKTAMEILISRVEKSNVRLILSTAELQKNIIKRIEASQKDTEAHIGQLDTYQRNFENRVTEVLEQIHRATFFGGICYGAGRVSEKIKVLVNRFVKK